MRTLERNKRCIFVAKSLNKTAPILDEAGNKTGEFEPAYSEPYPIRATVSVPRGNVYNQPFAKMDDYDKLIVIDNELEYIDRSTRLWIDTSDFTQPHDYEVKSISIMEHQLVGVVCVR